VNISLQCLNILCDCISLHIFTLYFTGSKRKHRETTHLRNYFVSNTTGAECSVVNMDEVHKE